MTTTTLFAGVLLLSSIGVMQTKGAAADGNIVFSRHGTINGMVAIHAVDEGNIRTVVAVSAFEVSRVNNLLHTNDRSTAVCAQLLRFNTSSPDTGDTDIEDCNTIVGDAALDADLAGFSGVKFTRQLNLEDLHNRAVIKTVTVSVDLTPTGKAQSIGSVREHGVTEDEIFVFNDGGEFRPVSGSLSVSGDFAFNTHECCNVDGRIFRAQDGTVTIERH